MRNHFNGCGCVSDFVVAVVVVILVVVWLW